MIMFASHQKLLLITHIFKPTDWELGPLHFSPSRVMYFHYESGYDPRDLVAQFRQEKKVAKDIGLVQRRHFLGLMENLVCHFHGISNADESITPTRKVMSMDLIKMKMSNEAINILSRLNDHDPPTPPPRKKELTRKVYKYQCSVSSNQCNVQMMHLLMLRRGGWGSV